MNPAFVKAILIYFSQIFGFSLLIIFLLISLLVYFEDQIEIRSKCFVFIEILWRILFFGR